MGDPLLDVSKAKLTHCRMCAKQKNYAELLDLTADVKTFEEYIDIVDFLQLDFLDLSNETLPKTTCEKCYDTFQEAYNSFKKLSESQQILKNLYNISVDVNVKIEPTERNTNFVNDNNSNGIREIPETLSNMGNTLSNVDDIASESSGSTSGGQIDPLSITHCRFCAKQYNKTDLYNLLLDKIKCDECITMLHFFKRNMNFINSKLPNNSCQPCFSALQKAYNYFKTVKRNQMILNNIYNMKLENILKIKIEPYTIDDNPEEDTPLSLCNIMVLNNDTWLTYPWVCKFCHVVFAKIEDLRSHSKEQHNMCHAFMCVDCKQTFDTFDNFVEHVRIHRNMLSLYCQFCNTAFETSDKCISHTKSHYASTQKICNLCGEIFPYLNSLEYHQQLYGLKVLEGSVGGEKSWSSYDWSCLECPTRFPELSSLRTHVQFVHDKCFAMKCMDCTKDTKNFKLFVAHVTTHRSYLKKFCQYCNMRFEVSEALNQHIIQHITSQQRPCNMCGQIFEDNKKLAKHKRMYAEGKKNKKQNRAKRGPKDDGVDVKPVPIQPKKRRPRRKISLSVDDLTCKTCSKFCETTTKLKRHVMTHDESRPRDWACQLCGSAFLTSSSLRDHVKKHSERTEVCQVCSRKFYTRHQLKAHIVTHSEDKPFVCDECGANFKTKRRLKCHLFKHTDIKPFQCSYCFKEFKFKENLKTHEYQHTGVRPYACEYCERTFTNWANCNKHMIRKHGIRLARTKITEHGRLTIDRRTGEASAIATDTNTKEWLTEMMKPEKPGKRTKRGHLKKSAINMI